MRVLKFYTHFWIVFSVVLLLPLSKSLAQLDAERIAWSRLQSGKWESSHRLLKKALQKDPSNLEANYVLAHWFFFRTNPNYQIDSAHVYVIKSIRKYDTLSVKDRERFHKFPIDSLNLLTLRSKIDSAAFERAKSLNTEVGYINFINDFNTASQIVNAIELRDEISFLEALKTNTYQSYQAYLSKYPQSHRAGEATERYEKLLFEDKTKNRRLASFKLFFSQYPESPYADEAQRQVFEISTASGKPEDFLNFMTEYPSSRYEKFVRDILFHSYIDREEVIPSEVLSDSLKNVLALNARYWIPFLKNNQFGFMDQTGEEVLAPQFQDVRDEYKCGSIIDDILALPDGYFSRSGKKIANYTSSIKSIGLGFLAISEQSCLRLIHKSGREIVSDCYEEYKVVADHFIGARRNGSIALFTLAGRKLPMSGITHIDEAEGLILLTKSEKKIVNTTSQLAALADGNPFHDELVFDEVKAVDNGLLWVRNSGLEGIIDHQLNYVVPLGRHTLTKTSFGLIQNDNGRITVRGLSSALENNTYDKITYHRNWLVLVNAGKTQLVDVASKQVIEADVDSVKFDRSLTFVYKNKSQKVYLSATHSLNLQPDSKIQFVASRDSVQFFFTETKKKHTLFTLAKAEQLFVTELELIESLGTDYFVVAKGNKKGLLNRNGKIVVPVEMDAILLTNKNDLSLLKDKKFGLYELRSKKYFKPVYERNLIPLDKKNLVAFKDGFYGLINFESKPITDFEFSEVQAWNDSVIWVKKDFQWRLLNFTTRKVLLDKVKDFVWIKNADDEKIVQIHQENYYGILSNRKGIVIPASFTTVINLGTADQPFYFTDKEVEEAGIFVVVYYNKQGKLVRKQAYEEEEYERILCEDH